MNLVIKLLLLLLLLLLLKGVDKAGLETVKTQYEFEDFIPTQPTDGRKEKRKWWKSKKESGLSQQKNISTALETSSPTPQGHRGTTTEGHRDRTIEILRGTTVDPVVLRSSTKEDLCI